MRFGIALFSTLVVHSFANAATFVYGQCRVHRYDTSWYSSYDEPIGNVIFRSDRPREKEIRNMRALFGVLIQFDDKGPILKAKMTSTLNGKSLKEVEVNVKALITGASKEEVVNLEDTSSRGFRITCSLLDADELMYKMLERFDERTFSLP